MGLVLERYPDIDMKVLRQRMNQKCRDSIQRQPRSVQSEPSDHQDGEDTQ